MFIRRDGLETATLRSKLTNTKQERQTNVGNECKSTL